MRYSCGISCNLVLIASNGFVSAVDSTAAVGDLVHVPVGIRHRFKNKTAHATRMIFLFTPGGPEEAFLDYLDPARPGELPPPLGPDQLERYVEMARRTNVDNLPDLT